MAKENKRAPAGRESMTSRDQRLLYRDCYAQLRSVLRLLTQLSDDLGDAELDCRGPDTETESKMLAEAQDAVSEAETRLQLWKTRLLGLSHGRITK